MLFHVIKAMHATKALGVHPQIFIYRINDMQSLDALRMMHFFFIGSNVNIVYVPYLTFM